MPPAAPDPLHPTVRAYVQSEALAETYDEYFSGLPLFEYDCLFLEDHLAPPGRVLDLGCGTGRHLAYLAQRGFTPVGLDLNPHMLGRAAGNLRELGLAPRLVRGDFHAPPFRPDARFDAILLMFSTLGLVRPAETRRALLAALRPHLASGGRLILHVHNRNYRADGSGWNWSDDALARLRGLEPGDRMISGYRGVLDLCLHLFARDELEDLLGRAGYRIAEVRPLNVRRDGPYLGPDADRNANGFLAAASP